MIIDLVTGTISGIMSLSNKTSSGKLSSNVMLKGILKKLMYIAIVVIAYRIDIMLNIEYLRDTTIILFICNDTLSILENATNIGVPVPNFLKNILHDVKEREESNNGKIK
ncbi:MAG: phage holin family protein [Lachnospiraceae bacterium]|nr:phage holin family protein [Lachnospiraceae bacterium]